ncbi:hypothetical protein CE195_00685, partial [Sodalis-like symbiont of Philaenus spumarius]
LILVEFSDVIFSLDSIPAIFAVTTDPNPFVLLITKHESWHPIFPKNTECKQTFLQNNSSW